MESELTGNFMIMAGVQDDEGESARARLRSLVARARLGEADAFEQLITRYQRQVFGTALRLLGNIDDARDAAQETFLRLHKYLNRFDEERELAPWLYQMTVNVCRELGRKRRPALSLEQEQEQGRLDTLAASNNVETEIHTAQERRIIAEALATLSEKERAAVVLRDIEGLETKAVARILGVTEATVRSQISMARVKIKKYRDRILKGR